MHRFNRSLIQFIIGVVIAVYFSGKGMAQENTEWKDRFFAEAPKRWDDYLRFARSLQLSGTSVRSTRYEGASRSPETQIRSEFKQINGACLHIFETIEPKGEAEAEGINHSYSFKLKRRSPNKGWIIMDLTVSDQSTTFGDEQKKQQEMHVQTICDCLMLWNLWLPTLIHDPDFTITSIKPQDIDGKPAVRFDFDYPKSDKNYPRKGAIQLKGGWMVLDPEHDWIMREYLVHRGQPEKYFMRKLFRIREGTDSHPIITHASLQIVGKGEKPFESIGEGQFQMVERSDVPLEEFTLSAFGLPEPAGTHVVKSRLYLWIALAGIVCLAIAILIRWLSRRAGTAA